MKEKFFYTLLGSVIVASYYLYSNPKSLSKNQETQTPYDKCDQSVQTYDDENSVFLESTIYEYENIDNSEGVFSFSSQLTTSSDNSDIDWKYVIQGLE